MKIVKLVKKTTRGSFTVEASFLFPILVLLTAFFLQASISLYSEVAKTAQDTAQLRELDGVEIFLRTAQIKAFGEIISDER